MIFFKQLYKTGRRDKEKTILKPHFGEDLNAYLWDCFCVVFIFQLRNVSENTSVFLMCCTCGYSPCILIFI